MLSATNHMCVRTGVSILIPRTVADNLTTILHQTIAPLAFRGYVKVMLISSMWDLCLYQWLIKWLSKYGFKRMQAVLN